MRGLRAMGCPVYGHEKGRDGVFRLALGLLSQRAFGYLMPPFVWNFIQPSLLVLLMCQTEPTWPSM